MVYNFFQNGHFGFRFLPKLIRTSLYSMSVATANMKLIDKFVIKLWSAQAFSSYFHKMAAGGHLVFQFSPNKSIGFFHSRSSMAVSNMNLIRSLVSQLRETQALVCGGGGGGDGVQNKTIILKFRGYNNKYMYQGNNALTLFNKETALQPNLPFLSGSFLPVFLKI